MTTSENHKEVVHGPISTRTNERTEKLLAEIEVLKSQLATAVQTIDNLNNLLQFERAKQ